jgi:2',3'-cyclic-nucleotide 2'-phosphodiesterase (5'-nucleotidase family)
MKNECPKGPNDIVVGEEVSMYKWLLAGLLIFYILHFNDVYEIEPVNGGELGGAARIATLVNERADKNPLMLFSGDTFSPSIMSTLFQGSQMVDVYNHLGLDYAVWGNHEFDYGPELALQRAGESQFPWLSTNLLDAQTGEPLSGGVHLAVTDWNGTKVGLIGLVNNWLNLTSAGDNAQYNDYIPAAQAAVAELKAQGAELIIALTHMDMADDRELATAVPEIDLILGGHDHDPMHEVVNGTLIWKTGSDFRTLGELRVFKVPGQKDIILPKYIPVTANITEDPDMAAVVASYTSQLDAELGQVIGETTVALDATRSGVRTGESNFGNIITDAIRAYAQTDVAIMNGGGIRTDQMYGPGELTKRDIYAVLPFGNIVTSIELTGAQLKEALENGVTNVEDGAGKFPQVSGLSFVYDPSAPAGARLVEVVVGGAPLDETRTYTVAINDFINEGGDGYEVFASAPQLITEATGPLLATVVVDYVAANGPISPAVEGRISTK